MKGKPFGIRLYLAWAIVLLFFLAVAAGAAILTAALIDAGRRIPILGVALVAVIVISIFSFLVGWAFSYLEIGK